MLADLRTEAKRQNISVCSLIRKVLEDYLASTRIISMRLGGRTAHSRLTRVNLHDPLVNWTADEQKYADEKMRIFREEDR